jgi:hypothetical protein
MTVVDLNSTSDESLKDNVQEITDPMLILSKITGVGFNWKDNGRKSYGVIAQEIEKILPDAVGVNAENRKTVNYISLIAFLIQAVKEQQIRIDELYRRLN